MKGSPGLALWYPHIPLWHCVTLSNADWLPVLLTNLRLQAMLLSKGHTLPTANLIGSLIFVQAANQGLRWAEYGRVEPQH